MRYKGIELKAGENSEAELLVNVEITGEIEGDELEEKMEEIENLLYELTDYDDWEVYVDVASDKILLIRCDDITFDEDGVQIITTIYNDIIAAKLSDVNIAIGVHVDGEEWFQRDDGSEYNEDIVTLDEFLEKLEY